MLNFLSEIISPDKAIEQFLAQNRVVIFHYNLTYLLYPF